MKIINTNQIKTYDITDNLEIINIDYETFRVTVRWNTPVHFTHCTGQVVLRSRCTRPGTPEYALVKNMCGYPIIDAGFKGRLVFTFELVPSALTILSKSDTYVFVNLSDRAEFDRVTFAYFERKIFSCFSISTSPFPTDYYKGSNMEDVEAEIVFEGN